MTGFSMTSSWKDGSDMNHRDNDKKRKGKDKMLNLSNRRALLRNDGNREKRNPTAFGDRDERKRKQQQLNDKRRRIGTVRYGRKERA